jgi:hypothetical protein
MSVRMSKDSKLMRDHGWERIKGCAMMSGNMGGDQGDMRLIRELSNKDL